MTHVVRSGRVAALLVATMVVGLGGGCSQSSRLDAKCVAGDVQACTQLGDMYASGRGVPRDLGRAGQAYERACNLGAPDVCNTLGEIVEMTGEIEGGPKRAEELFQRACLGGCSPGCLNLGLAAAAREEFTLAVSLFEKSCDGGWAPGCHQLGLSCQEGQGAPKDLSKAIALFVGACDGEFTDSCVLLGNLYAAGDAVPKDNAQAVGYYGKALKIFQESCLVGNAADCSERDRLRTRIALIAAEPAASQAGQQGPAAATGAAPIK
jgi:TPR repeat protein